MKKFVTAQALILLSFFSNIAFAAPYYQGIGCNADGTSCLLGVPTHRVTVWYETGKKNDLGEQCENFIARTTQRVQALKAALGDVVDLQYKNFSAAEVTDSATGIKSNIECSVQIHSENANLLLKDQLGKRHFWTCKDKSQPGVCRTEQSTCDQDLAEALKDPTLLQAKVVISGSVLQGVICQVSGIRASLKQ